LAQDKGKRGKTWKGQSDQGKKTGVVACVRESREIMRKGTLSEDILQSQQGAPREKRCGFDNSSHKRPMREASYVPVDNYKSKD
jgi:hypothetical protein